MIISIHAASVSFPKSGCGVCFLYYLIMKLTHSFMKACGKVNLGLDVIGKRKDGYHLVRMIMQSVDLHDEMRVRYLPSEEPGIILKCNLY